MEWSSKGASALVLFWCNILEALLVVVIGLLSPLCQPRALYRAREAVIGQRKRLLLLRRSNEDGGDGAVGGGDGGRYGLTRERAREGLTEKGPKAAAAAASVEGLPDLGGRYLDFLAQALGQSHSAALAAATTPYRHDGLPCSGGGHPEGFFVDVSAYDEVVLTTEWEADGFLAACILFAVVTAEARRSPAPRDGIQRPYPLRTLIVGEGKSSQAREALMALRQTKLIPADSRIDVFESGDGAATGEKRRWRERAEGEGEEDGDSVRRSFLGSCSMLLLQSMVGPWRWLFGGGRRGDLARAKLRELFTSTRRHNQRVLVIALKPPRELVKVLLEGGGGASWWNQAMTMGQVRSSSSTFEHVDLLVSGGFSGVWGRGEGRDATPGDRLQRRRSGHASRDDGELCRHDVEEALAKVSRVFIVQLDDLVGPYGFPRAIAPDRTPTLSAAMAGARGVLPSCLRRVIAASNHLALTEFPDKVASAISMGRYANEGLRVTAAAIAAAAVAEEPGIGRGRVAELGACMADLIASDFEALEAAGLSPGTQQAVFRSLDVGMALSDVAAAWALARQDAVCWESCPRVGVDTSAGYLVPLHDRRGEAEGGRGGEKGDGGWRSAGGRGAGAAANGYAFEDGEDFADRGDSCCRMGFNRGKGDARGISITGEQQQQQQQEDEKLLAQRAGGSDGCRGSGIVGYLATGFADGFERLEDQEAGYAAFAAFLVRVLDQMP